MTAALRAKGREPRFSVVTIVRNEADRLPVLLASLAEFRRRGGEVLVLDTGSDDGTAAVARAAACRVTMEPRRFNGRLSERQARRINEAFCQGGDAPLVSAGERLFNFARARNCAAALARNDFQLVLDGGDVVEVLDLDWIDASIREGRSSAYSFETRVRNRAGWSVELHDCFYDRRSMKWKGRAHNYLVPVVPAQPRNQVPLSPKQLLVSHHSDLQKSRGHQVAGTALEALADPASARWRYFLARALGASGRHRSGVELALGLDRPDVPPAVRSAGLGFAAHCLAGTGAPSDEIDALLLRAACRDSSRRDPLLRLAQRRLAANDMQGAASFAAAALAIAPRVGLSEPEENHSVRPHAILYWALLWLGRLAEARPHFETCRTLDPSNPVYAEHARLFGRP